MSETKHIIKDLDLLAVIFSYVAELTQYDIKELDGSSHLEYDLGVDSITLAEVLSFIFEKVGISTSGTDAAINGEGVETINDIYFRVENLIDKQGISFSAQKSDTDYCEAKTAILNYIRQIISAHSGYSVTQLSVSADLNTELGIDSAAQLFALKDICNNFLLDTVPRANT